MLALMICVPPSSSRRPSHLCSSSAGLFIANRRATAVCYALLHRLQSFQDHGSRSSSSSRFVTHPLTKARALHSQTCIWNLDCWHENTRNV